MQPKRNRSVKKQLKFIAKNLLIFEKKKIKK